MSATALERALTAAADKLAELRHARAAAEARQHEDEDAWVAAEGILFEAERAATNALVDVLLVLVADQGQLVRGLLWRCTALELGARERLLRSAARRLKTVFERMPR